VLASLVSCTGGDPTPTEDLHSVQAGPVNLRAAPPRPVLPLSVASMDTASTQAPLAGVLLPVEAKFLVLAARDDEPELAAIRSALDYRGAPYDVFVASTEPPLMAGRLANGDHGFYQATILTSSALSVHGESTLDASEWDALASYEVKFGVRRVVLNAWPDPTLGFGPSTELNADATPLLVRCTTAGALLFRDVSCDHPQQIAGTFVYPALALDQTQLTPLLTDAAGKTVAAIHHGSDGRESLLLLFGNNERLLHSLLLIHGVIGWVSGGTYLGDRYIDLSAQVDDLFLASKLWPGGTYRLDDSDLRNALAWVQRRRSSSTTPNFRVALAFNAVKAHDGDPLTETVKLQNDQWHWISHTFDHAVLDSVDYAAAFDEFDRNRQAAATLQLVGYDVRNIVTPNVSGLINVEAMRAAADVGIRFAVTDTSREGCNNPSPNTAFYNAIAPSLLMVPRRPTNLYYNVSTPAEWVAEYNALNHDEWGRDSSYAQVIDQESEVLLHYLLRGETDPWMFHQANLRAYDGAHSLLSDLIDATLTKLATRSRVQVRTPPMEATGLRFAARMQYEGAGVRATLYRGRALLIDVARATSVPVTGMRSTAGEAYGGDRVGMVSAVPGTTTCVPLDLAGTGCSPPPVRLGGPGPAQPVLVATCNASSATPPMADAGGPMAPDAGDVAGADAAPIHGDAEQDGLHAGDGCSSVAVGVASPGSPWLPLLVIWLVVACLGWKGRGPGRKGR